MKKSNAPPLGGWGHYDSPHVVGCQSKKRWFKWAENQAKLNI